MMTRKELYRKIKELNLQDEVKKVYGDNYTRVGNIELAHVIQSAQLASNIAKNITKKDRVKDQNLELINNCKCDKLIEVLKKKHILLDSEIMYINS